MIFGTLSLKNVKKTCERVLNLESIFKKDLLAESAKLGIDEPPLIILLISVYI